MNKHTQSRHSGITLIELMVVMSVVAILAALAIPAYQAHVTRTYRGAAKVCLSEYAQFMERYYTTNMTYEDAAPNQGCAQEGAMGDRYTFAVTSQDESSFTVSATPINVQAERDTLCSTLTLDQAGTRGVGGSGTLQQCWAK